MSNTTTQPVQTGKFRKKRVYFSQVSNVALRDKTISLRAKGLYSLIQSYITLENFDLYKWHLMNQCKEGRDAFNSAWIELKKSGYLKHYRVRANNGHFYYEYELLDEPDPTPTGYDDSDEETDETPEPAENKDFSPHTENPYTAFEGLQKPHTENPSPVTPTEATPAQGNPYVYNNTLNNNNLFNNNQSVSQSNNKQQLEEKDGQTDGQNYSNRFLKNELEVPASVIEELQDQIEYDYFQMHRPEYVTLVDTLVDYMAEMITAPYTKINGVMQSRESLRRYIDKVSSMTINDFIKHMKGKELRGISNPIAYWRSAFLNMIKEIELMCATV